MLEGVEAVLICLIYVTLIISLSQKTHLFIVQGVNHSVSYISQNLSTIMPSHLQDRKKRQIKSSALLLVK